MSEAQDQLVRAALEKVYRYYNEAAGPASKDQRTHDFVFHMTDWYSDLVRLSELYADPKSHSQKEWNDGVFGFLLHAVGHLMPAAKLANILSDPFHAVTKPKRPARKRRQKASAVS